jgi:hypothetical protein
VPISVIEHDGMCSIRAGGDGSSAQRWLDRQKAVPVAGAARRFAGANPDLFHGHTGTVTAATADLAAKPPRCLSCVLHRGRGRI